MSESPKDLNFDDDEWESYQSSLQDQEQPLEIINIFPQIKQNPPTPKQKVKFDLPPINLLEKTCTKGGFHTNQRLNLICKEPTCKQDPLLCVICFQQQHFGHKVCSLRLAVERSRKSIHKMNSLTASMGQMKDILKDSQKTLVGKYFLFDNQVRSLLTNIKAGIKDTHYKINQRLELKLNSSQTAKQVDQLQSVEVKPEEFQKLISDLLTGIPADWKQDDEDENNQTKIQTAVINFKNSISKQLDNRTKTINEMFQKYISLLATSTSNNFFSASSIQYQFRQDTKHEGIILVSPKVVVSKDSDSYRFALMEPSLQRKGLVNQKFTFKINEDTGSWVAIGIAHKETIIANNYTFNYSDLYHGAYMISSNGGSWSSISSEHNNVVTSFNFYKNDSITVEYDPTNKKVNFQKSITSESYSIDFEFNKDDQLHLCVLFYYNTDEVQYLGQSKEPQKK